jgi:hypothetical protein
MKSSLAESVMVLSAADFSIAATLYTPDFVKGVTTLSLHPGWRSIYEFCASAAGEITGARTGLDIRPLEKPGRQHRAGDA